MIDLMRGELTFVDASPTWRAARPPESTTLVLERDGRSATPVVVGAIEPFPETAVLLNTRGRGTEFDETVVPGLAADENERLGGGVSGADVVGTRAGDSSCSSEARGSRFRVSPFGARWAIRPRSSAWTSCAARSSLDADPGGVVTWQLGGHE